MAGSREPRLPYMSVSLITGHVLSSETQATCRPGLKCCLPQVEPSPLLRGAEGHLSGAGPWLLGRGYDPPPLWPPASGALGVFCVRSQPHSCHPTSSHMAALGGHVAGGSQGPGERGGPPWGTVRGPTQRPLPPSPSPTSSSSGASRPPWTLWLPGTERQSDRSRAVRWRTRCRQVAQAWRPGAGLGISRL